MAPFQRTSLALVIALVVCFIGPPVFADDAGEQFRIGLIDEDPAQALRNFDPFVEYLGSRLKSAGIREVTVFVARDLEQMRTRIRRGQMDFVLASAFPIVDMGRHEIAPTLVAVQDGARDYAALFFVTQESPLRDLRDLQGKTLVFGTSSSTAGYALARTELVHHAFWLSEEADAYAPADAVRYQLVGEAINQAVWVIRGRADAGVFSSSDWEELPPNVQSRLRIIHRTAPITRLLGAFRPAVAPAVRDAVEKTLVEMSGNREGRAALAGALHTTQFERLTEGDRSALQNLKQRLAAPDAE